MTTQPVLDLLALHSQLDVVQSKPRGLWSGSLKLLTALVLLGGLAIASWQSGVLGRFASWQQSETIELQRPPAREVEQLTVDDPGQIISEGGDAEERNAQIPVLEGPKGRMDRFYLSSEASGSYRTALKCLSQAVYYEAAREPLEGRRAVAQVVLNRLRHPAYPKSVCGVVYQGAERRTGCQFSFTCDGALLRPPLNGLWREAEQVAREALGGYVESQVGTSTHYHADYVLPRWAFTLGKIGKLGHHIFYRFNNTYGSVPAFTGRYSGHEFIPQLDFAALRLRLAANGETDQVPATLVPGLSVTPHVTDRHADSDVAGRLDVSKSWRLTIPDSASASSSYQRAVASTASPSIQQVESAEGHEGQ